jgi:hypothetical protein
MQDMNRTAWALIASIAITSSAPSVAMGGGTEGAGPMFTGGTIAITGSSSWETASGIASDSVTSSQSIEPTLADASGSTSGEPVVIAGEMLVSGTIAPAEGFFSEYVIDFYVIESASIGAGVNGAVDMQLDGDIKLSLDQSYAFLVVQDGPAKMGVLPDLSAPNPGVVIGNVLLPGAYTLTIDSAIALAQPGDLVKQTTWVMTLTAQGPPNSPPECADGVTVELWPPNHQYVPIDLNELAGAIDPDKNPITYTITSITQDEPSNSTGDGDTTCDGAGEGHLAMIRAERKGNGDGRVYHISYVADDGNGGTCEGVLLVTVPHNVGQPAVDSGQDYVSNECVSAADINSDGMVNVDDLLWVIQSWGFTGPDATLNWPDADANIDGIVEVTDLLIVINNWGSA